MAEIPKRPPFPPSQGVAFGVAYLAALPLLSAPFVLIIAAVSLVDGDWAVLARAVVLSVALTPFAVVAFGLARRRPATRVAALALCLAVTVGSGVAVVYPFVWPPENGHGIMYVVIGAFQWFVFGVVVCVQIMRTAGPEAFRPPLPGWLEDPARVARLRYWDGIRWTEHVAP